MPGLPQWLKPQLVLCLNRRPPPQPAKTGLPPHHANSARAGGPGLVGDPEGLLHPELAKSFSATSDPSLQRVFPQPPKSYPVTSRDLLPRLEDGQWPISCLLYRSTFAYTSY